MPTPTPVTRPPRLLIFDVGNVLLRWDPRPALAADGGDEIADAVLAGDDFDFAAWNLEQDRGRSFDDAEAEVAKTHPRLLPAIRSYRANFAKSLTGVIEGTVAITREVGDLGIPMVALTNFSEETFARTRELYPEVFAPFIDMIVSATERVTKPDPRIYAILLARIAHLATADQCLFVDDNPGNVAAAHAAGMDAVVFTTAETLRTDLIARGLALRPVT
ncbi:MAG: HAD-IA family hydrolase [Tetrasphaera sp.]|jgi:2-haloacid dehalogenase|nr:HAD-IA family hydrolase [Tetrasphaera sp.]